MEKEKPNCPECKTNGLVVPTVFGFIRFDEDSIKKMDDFESLGCFISSRTERINCTEENPQGEIRRFYVNWYCRYCERGFE